MLEVDVGYLIDITDHQHERIKNLEGDIKYLKSQKNHERSNKIPQDKLEVEEEEKESPKENVQKTTQELIETEQIISEEVVNLREERVSNISVNLTKQSWNSNNLKTDLKYSQVDVTYKGTKYNRCTVLSGNNEANEFKIIVIGDTIKGALNRGLNENDVNEFRELVRSTAARRLEIIRLANN